MDRLHALNESRTKIYEDIKRLVSPALGPDIDFDEEVKALHHIWSESPDSTRLNPKTPLQVLLLEYERVCSEIEPIRVDAELTRIEETAASITGSLDWRSGTAPRGKNGVGFEVDRECTAASLMRFPDRAAA